MNVAAFLIMVLGAIASAETPPAPGTSPATEAQTNTYSGESIGSPGAQDHYFDEEAIFRETPVLVVDVLMISLGAEKLEQLLPELRDPAKIASAQAKLLEMVARKEATMIDWPEATTQQGKRGIYESITEKRYAIDFQYPPAVEKGQSNEPKASSDFAPPTAFETRNLGTSLEFQGAASADAKCATIELAAQSVDFLRFDSFVVGKDPKGGEVKIQQPIARSCRAVQTLTLKSGERRLIYATKLTDGNGAACVFIAGLRIDAHK